MAVLPVAVLKAYSIGHKFVRNKFEQLWCPEGESQDVIHYLFHISSLIPGAFALPQTKIPDRAKNSPKSFKINPFFCESALLDTGEGLFFPVKCRAFSDRAPDETQASVV